MESIDPANSSARFSNPPIAHASKAKNSSELQTNESKAPANRESAYADIFDDEALERPQNNLQSVSELASQALERLKKEG